MITVIANLKGGTGKSTLTFNLAVWLARRGKEIQLFDLDPQATLSDVLQIRSEEDYRPLLEAEQDFTRLTPEMEGDVLVDIGVSDNSATRHALATADRIVAPVQPSQADIWSIQRFISMTREAAAHRERPPPVLTFVNRADTHRSVRETDEAEASLRQLRGVEWLDARLYQRTLFRRSFSEGLAVFELEPSGKAAEELNRLAGLLYP
ncbi:MAG: ParA family protein [Gammaproteobacteria bacterium]|nr:ParA family protein [Gammaproteobacteria bacterium]MBU1655970.1 ParA family protein [Gammaproteobacteria bacterium]MBU1962545.1 ParA family protein [Gammaproteobacteria bacterium]